MDLYDLAALVARLAEPYASDWPAHHAVGVALDHLQVDHGSERERVAAMAIACLVFASHPRLLGGGITPDEFKELTYGTEV